MTLSFRLGKIPVQVHPVFFILVLFLGSSDWKMIVPWLVVVFVAVLLHELGHAMTGMAFGLQPRIDLHGMGGTTSWSTPKTLSSAKRILISLAGPFTGFGLWAVVYALDRAGVFPDNDASHAIIKMVQWVTVYWGVFNLLPVLPLDGGNVMLQVLQGLTGGRGERAARVVSIVGAVLLLLLVIKAQMGLWGVMLGGMFVLSNYQGLQALKATEHDAPMRESLKQAYAALESKDAERLVALARPVALGSQTAQVKAEALQLLAFGFLLEGRVADADAAIAALPKGYEPHPSLLQLRADAASRA